MLSPLFRRLRAGLAAVSLALLPAVTLLPSTAAAETVTIRVGYASIGVGNRPFVGGSSAALAHAEKYLEDEFKNDPGVAIEWFFFKGAGPAVNEAIANRQLDFALQGDLPSLVGRANGLKTRLLLASGAHVPTYLVVPTGSDIKTLKDLKGRKVAIFRGTNLHLAINKALAANGLHERDLKVVNMDFATMKAALATKDIDAAFGDPSFLPLEEQGIARIAYSTKGDNPAFARHAHVLATDDFAAAHPDLTRRVVKAFVRAAYWASQEENREALFGIWSKSGIPADTFRADYAGQPLRLRGTPLFDDFLIAQYAEQAVQARELGLLRRDVSVDGWFDLSHLKAALKELQLEDFWPRRRADGSEEKV